MIPKQINSFIFLLFFTILVFSAGCIPEGTSLPPTAIPDPSVPVVGSTYTITATAGEHGSISPSGEIIVPVGESQTFYIIPDQYYQIGQVYVNGSSDGPADTIVITITGESANITIHATFTGKQEVRIQGNPYIYETILSAFNVAKNGDTIIVYPGIYHEYLLFDSKNITLRGCDPSDPSIVADTIIDGGGANSVVKFIGDDTSILEGLTLRNGYGDRGAGIYIYRCSPTIRNNIITGNLALISGAGIYMEYSSPTITGNTITDNHAQVGNGGGIKIMWRSSPTITENIINENTAALGAGIFIYDSSPTITNNDIMNNSIRSGNGGGIYVENSFPIIGSINSVDTGNFNNICGNNPDQIYPDAYPNNYINDICS